LGNESFTLTSLNSQLSFGQDTTINATQSPQNLTIDALDPNGGFGIAGTVTDGTGMWNVQWNYANGSPYSLMSISLVDTSSVSGFNKLIFPSSFETAQLSDVQPIPEPSSLLLLGTGGLSFLATGLRTLRSRSA
jgi:PEP-CTERM motif-containing protein